MNTQDKMAVLSAAARYDASCASSGSARKAADGGMGAGSVSGICHSWSDDGRCISLLKILLTNQCIYDCAYCVNRRSNDIPRAAFTVEEVVSLTMEFYRRNYIEGLFLSSGVMRSPDYTMERMAGVAERLRALKFGGYIHLKAIPGASPELIRRAGLAADRLSVNIELPSEKSLQLLAPEKRKDDILVPMKAIGAEWQHFKEERRRHRSAPTFSPAGQSTQMIVGASPESDFQIINLADHLYRRYQLRRVYYSAYVGVNDDTRLPGLSGTPPLLREHRLYQADWLVRLYGFGAGEIVSQDRPFLDPNLDPKAAWALQHLDRFPVDVRRASYEELLRVPGIGLMSARRIVRARRFAALGLADLQRLGVVLKRAGFFISLGGRVPEEYRWTAAAMGTRVLPALRSERRSRGDERQMELPLGPRGAPAALGGGEDHRSTRTATRAADD